MGVPPPGPATLARVPCSLCIVCKPGKIFLLSESLCEVQCFMLPRNP
jgi:hypothetical protein